MDNGFKRFKRKIRISAVFRALLMGVSLGVIAFAALWLVAGLVNTAEEFTPDFAFYGGVGGIVALVCSAIFAIVLLPTDKRLARRLDDKLELHEKVQTLVAFRHDNSDMVVMQRENAQQLLMQTPTKKARNKSVWLTLILPVVACCCLAAPIIVTAQESSGPSQPSEKIWRPSDFDMQKVRDLIAYTQSSGLQEETKAGVVDVLWDLLDNLEITRTEQDMQTHVVNAIVSVYETCQVCHTHTKVSNALRASMSQDVVSLGDTLLALNSSTLVNYIATLRENVKKDRGVAARLASELRTALETSGEAAEHPLQKALADFADELAGVTEDISELELEALIKRGEDAIIKAIRQPALDVGVERYVINNLISIFQIPTELIPAYILETFPEVSSGDLSDPSDETDKPSNAGGGMGKGELLFGSDDQIYDPGKNDLVIYGEVLDEYRNIMMEFMMDGKSDSELQAMIDEYLSILYRVTEEE